MKLPELQKPERYAGLYIFDFGDYVSVGYTAEEVAELLESEKYREGKVYKIHRAYADGRLEIKGVSNDRFQLESGMFFYAVDAETARDDFKRLSKLGVTKAPPCRSKVHLAKYDNNKYVTALIYPAEYEDEISTWLIEGQYRTSGAAEGGIGSVGRYYEVNAEILERHQFFGQTAVTHRSGDELLANIKAAVQR